MARRIQLGALALAVMSAPGRSCESFAGQTDAVNRECCGNDDAVCQGGMPSSCDAGCASVFLPLWRNCQSELTAVADFSAVLSLCEAGPWQAGSCDDGTCSNGGTCVANTVNLAPSPPPAYTATIDVYESESADNSPYNAVAGKTTYRLRLVLGPTMASVYAMFGDATNLPHVPAAYFNSFATDATTPPSSDFYTMNPTMFNDLMLTSFLALGPSDKATAANTGFVGTAIGDWHTGGAALTVGNEPGPTNDFSLFWMDPPSSDLVDYSDVGGPLIAQLTLDSDTPFFVKLGLQGKSMEVDGHRAEDWDENAVIWMHAPGGRCPPGMGGIGCMVDIDECASAGPLAECTNGCWNGMDVYECLDHAGETEPGGHVDYPQCSAGDITQRGFALERHCCSVIGPHPTPCPDGMPSACDADCAAVFMPLWKECQNELTAHADYSDLVAQCQATVAQGGVGVGSFQCICADGFSGATCQDGGGH